MDCDESFASLFSDSPCSFQELMEVPDTNDKAHPHALHNSTEPTATQQNPPSEGRDQSQEETLGLLQLSEWDQDKSYGDDPSRYIRYTMLWKVTRNGKRFARDTLSDLALTPSAQWSRFTEPEIQTILQEQSRNKKMIPQDTDVVVSVTKRGQPSFQRRFKETNIDWSVIEEQLLKWEQWFRAGKQLRVEVSLNFVDNPSDSGTSSKKGKMNSATQRQLAVQALQLGADGQNGQLPRWKELYEFMRCPDKFCNLGNYCWQDSVKQKHIPIGTFELMDLVEYVQKEGMLESHDDVPDSFRARLYAAEAQKSHRKRAAPGNHTEASLLAPPMTADMSVQVLNASMTSPLDIPGFKDDAVKDYVQYLQGQWRSQEYKDQFEEAGKLVLGEFIDLDVVFKDQKPAFFTDHGVPKGIATLFIDNIPVFAKRRKLNSSASIEEQDASESI
jgi:hypothetical protein